MLALLRNSGRDQGSSLMPSFSIARADFTFQLKLCLPVLKKRILFLTTAIAANAFLIQAAGFN